VRESCGLLWVGNHLWRLPRCPGAGNVWQSRRFKRTDWSCSEPFRPYEKLVEISFFGKKFQVPERNSLLRCFQFISRKRFRMALLLESGLPVLPGDVQLPDETNRTRSELQFIVYARMEITELSQELKWCLRAKLPSDTPVSS